MQLRPGTVSLACARLIVTFAPFSTYYLIHITKGNEWKTTFRTCYGSFEWLVMPFGLSNIPLVFQRFMNNIFVDMLDICMVVYLDNILIYSDNLKEHTKHIKEVLTRQQKNGLFTSPSKCAFHQDRIKFLGFVLSSEEI